MTTSDEDPMPAVAPLGSPLQYPPPPAHPLPVASVNLPTLPQAPQASSIAALPAYGPRHARQAVIGAFEMGGGMAWMAEWSRRNPDNEKAFLTQVFPKTIQREVAVEDRRGVEDFLKELDDPAS